MSLSPFFSDQQIATLRAAFNRLIPTDEFLNAWDNGAGDYLARQLEGDLASSLELYRAGLDSLNQEAQARYAQDFVTLNEAAQDELLACIERGEVQSEWAINPRQFFEAMLNHSAEGYYADPGNGGNREKTSWQMIGFLDR
ncbi:MAG TPA: gluconate 2-dehydrogenase subunit 3 family protein [Abditibacteriaceae bacterium]|jgi:hypothetical protein